VGGYPEYPGTYRRPSVPRPAREPLENRRSHAAIPVAVVVVAIGLYFGTDSLIVPALLGLVLLLAGLSFLSTRLNPLSPHFYLTRKPSWAAIGVVFLGAAALLGEAWVLWSTGGATRLVPHLWG
jgi:predicted histidine transporter YuiF (NhaC family)